MKPFLKWAGNKYQIIERIKAVLPKGSRLLEPFVGSGAVFLNTDYDQYLLTDANKDLIQLYQHVKLHGTTFIKDCQNFFIPENNVEQVFYELRSQFNTTTDPYLKSLLFVYLNKHCFNGLCRYNSKGEFNTPFGKHKKPYFSEKEMLHFYQRAQYATFEHMDFLAIMNSAKVGDIVYCDPPYVPLSKTANFTNYGAKGFDEQQQILLAKTAEQLAARNITVIISNHDTELTRQLYQTAIIHSFPVQRFISSDGANRNKATEVLAIFSSE
jgi:DNA adenine methylase